MRLTTFLGIAFATSAGAAAADNHYSDMIATTGLSGTATTLSALPNLTPSDQFALGGVHFLSVVEHALQTRYTYGMSGPMTDLLEIPLMRLPIFDNPTPDAFSPQVVEAIFADALTDLSRALPPLDSITDSDDVAVTIDVGDIWFDINMNTTRDPGEGFFDILGADIDRRLTDTPPLTIRFDTADAAWLSAYAHLLSGVSETILALEPADALETAFASGAAMDALRGGPLQSDNYFVDADTPGIADIIYGALLAIEGQPDVTRSRAAHAHFQGMIADNKVFWARVATESDNAAEWIPNKNQQSALPIAFPPETGQVWRQVLADAEKLLNGDLLIPHWRLGKTAGINLEKFMQDPPTLDIVGILQGRTVAQFAEQGRLINSRSLLRFEQMVGADAPLFMVLLN